MISSAKQVETETIQRIIKNSFTTIVKVEYLKRDLKEKEIILSTDFFTLFKSAEVEKLNTT